MQVSVIQRGKTFVGGRWSWVTGKAQTAWTAMNGKQRTQTETVSADVKVSNFAQSVLQVVLWVGFAGFLFASLPHVAYFFAAFEPENNGTVNDYWWTVSYILAIAIDVTSFFLSFNVAIKMRRATAGLPWYQKIIPAFLVFLAHWPFILLLVGFSWLVNFEHAKQFHSSMLDIAEQSQINLIIWQGQLSDLNPIIASAFPVLAVAYTGMADRIGDERKGKAVNADVKEDVKADVQVVTKSVNPVQQNVQQPAFDIEAILQTMQAMNAQNLQAMQQMTQQSLQVTIEQFTKVTVQAVKETVQSLPAYTPPTLLPEPGQTTSNTQDTDELEVVKKPTPPLQSEGDQGVQTYGDQIEALYNENPSIGPSEIAKRLGCTRQTASNWLKRVRPVEQ
jgi:hypothetical protein